MGKGVDKQYGFDGGDVVVLKDRADWSFCLVIMFPHSCLSHIPRGCGGHACTIFFWDSFSNSSLQHMSIAKQWFDVL